MRRTRLIVLTVTVFLASCGEQPAESAAKAVAGSRLSRATGAPAFGADQADPETQQVGRRISHFTNLTGTACKLSEEVEETGDWVRSCPGVGGYSLRWSSWDLREELEVVIDGKPAGLDLSNLVTNGAFDWLGETVEWRGPEGQPPDVLVMRVHFSRQDGTSDSGSLAIARLGRTPCVVALVRPGPDQSARARAVADKKLPPCLRA